MIVESVKVGHNLLIHNAHSSNLRQNHLTIEDLGGLKIHEHKVPKLGDLTEIKNYSLARWQLVNRLRNTDLQLLLSSLYQQLIAIHVRLLGVVKRSPAPLPVVSTDIFSAMDRVLVGLLQLHERVLAGRCQLDVGALDSKKILFQQVWIFIKDHYLVTIVAISSVRVELPCHLVIIIKKQD